MAEWFGFTVENIERESGAVILWEHGRVRFYTVDLVGLVVNGKTYGRVTVEYLARHGEAWVLSSAGFVESLTDSARSKISGAAEADAAARFAELFGTAEAHRAAVRDIIYSAARDEFKQDERRGMIGYAGKHRAPNPIDEHRLAGIERDTGAAIDREWYRRVATVEYAEILLDHIVGVRAAHDRLTAMTEKWED